LQKIPSLSYARFSEILGSKEMNISFMFKGKNVFDVVVPQNGFNPFVGPIGARFVEMILNEEIDVKDKSIIDLGCGCGNIGMAAILKGAAHVLFTDICPEYVPILKRNILTQNENHEFVTQDLLAQSFSEEKNRGRYDYILMSTPTFFNAKSRIYFKWTICYSRILHQIS